MTPHQSANAPHENAKYSALDTITEADLPALGRMYSLAFGGPSEQSIEWIRKGGFPRLRVLREESAAIAAVLLRIDAGQFYHGRNVRTLGIAGVAVAPEMRGQGHAYAMMREAMLEAHRDGYALSGLYASTQSLYRKVGYEQAGSRFIAKIPVTTLEPSSRDGRVISLGEADQAEVLACYNRFAARFHGMIDRSDYHWNRVKAHRDMIFEGFGIKRDDGTIAGYVYLDRKRKDTGRLDLVVQDLAFDDAPAALRLIGLLRDFAPMADEVAIPMGPWHPLLMMLGQQRYTLSLKDYWMIRVVDVERALTQRGYPHALDATLTLNVRDDLIKANDRRFVLRVKDGRGEVAPTDAKATATAGGKSAAAASISISVRALASLYSGLCNATQHQLIGACEGDARALNIADAVFASSSPWMTDFF
ncbi:MAG: GNAT family N-acetyltransferase [Phycisphaerales bacterium]|nr:GNAT family N-acetyltransferase [Phycisphaerales bacterium]